MAMHCMSCWLQQNGCCLNKLFKVFQLVLQRSLWRVQIGQLLCAAKHVHLLPHPVPPLVLFKECTLSLTVSHKKFINNVLWAVVWLSW